MKFSILYHAAKILFRFLSISLCLLYALQLWSIPEKTRIPTSTTLSNLSGNIWVETDGNSTFNGEAGPSGILVLLYDNEEDTIVSQSITLFGKYEFNGIGEGKYYLRIDQSAFDLGGPLFGQQSCPGINNANDMVDDDDNGSDTTPNDVLCSLFDLSNSDPMTDVSIEYIDFCFFATCEDQNPLVLPSCEDIMASNILCNINGLDNLCATMPTDSSAGNQPSPLCDGFNTSKNISWLAFTAADGNYSINISPIECQLENIGQEGIQVGIYTDCTFSESVFCSDQCTTASISIGSSLLNPGQVYYLYINGCNGNVCSYQININGSPTIPSLEPDDVCIFSDGVFQCEDITYCPNDDIIFRGQGILLSGEFIWSVTTVSGEPYLGDSIITTSENSLILNIPSEGRYNVCLTDVKNGCQNQDWSGVVCRVVTTSFSIPMLMDEDFGEFFVCDGEFDDFSINIFAGADPNGDGDSGWNAPIPDYMIGLNEATVSTEGCSYEQQFVLSSFIASPVEDVLITVCEEDLPVQIDALTFTIFNFTGVQSFTIENYLLQNSQDENGCDSIINLTVEKLNILQGILLDPICNLQGINLQFDYIADLSTDISFLEFVWKDPLGNILPFGTDPQTVIAPFESGNGEYTLEITIDKNGTACNYLYSTFVEIASFLPPSPTVSGPDIVCEGNDVSVYTAEGNGDETMFIWSFPNDVTSAAISGSTNEIITIDWTGSNGGEVVVIGQNICGQSNQTSYDVQIIPRTTPNFSIDTSVCVDNPTTIDFIGTGINITGYTWDFAGGTILSGNEMGPYEISWDIPGEKFVSLVTTDINGCPSNSTVEVISIKIPLTPTAVNCDPSVGEVEFTWEIPLMVSGFEVNVLSGQTGGIFTSNSFTVSGLEEGEAVTIELLTMPEDPICGEFVSTIITCVGLACFSPEIELSADQNVCEDDDNITIDATITSGETGTGIFTGSGIIDATNGIFDPSIANPGINTIIYTFTSDVADCVGSSTISIEVFESPVSSFTQDSDTLCITDELSLNYTGTPNAETFDWSFDDGVGSGLLTAQKVIFDSPGIKTISLQVSKNGCSSNFFSTTILVDPEIDDLTIQCDTTSTDFVTFSWNAISGVSLYEIIIDDNPPFFSPNTSITIDDLEEDQEVSISITSLSNTSCPGTTDTNICKTAKTPVSVNDQSLLQINVFPNPVQGLLFFEGVEDKNLSFELYSILGTIVNNGFVKSKSIDISLVPIGIYMLRVTDEKNKLHRDFKIIKE